MLAAIDEEVWLPSWRMLLSTTPWSKLKVKSRVEGFPHHPPQSISNDWAVFSRSSQGIKIFYVCCERKLL